MAKMMAVLKDDFCNDIWKTLFKFQNKYLSIGSLPQVHRVTITHGLLTPALVGYGERASIKNNCAT